MKILFYSTKSYDKKYFSEQNTHHILDFRPYGLDIQTTDFARGYDAICIFVNDICDADVIDKLYRLGVKAILLRCAGFNNVDIEYARKLNIKVARVPAYSPFSVAEHTLALLLCLNRKIHKAYNRVKENNFNIEGLVGFDIHKKTIGIIGFGHIGKAFAQICSGFGGKILVYDPYADLTVAPNYVTFVNDKNKLFAESDIISLHCPLNNETKYIINEDALKIMKSSAFIINTSRGALIDTKAIIKSLKSKSISALAIDVYEYEKDLFFKDMSEEIVDDDVFEKLLTLPNVLITAHQAFLTKEALDGIAKTTLDNASSIEQSQWNDNFLVI
ncbi:MAG: 2-hydroxyacid dehydrogenase [Francisella sp.]